MKGKTMHRKGPAWQGPNTPKRAVKASTTPDAVARGRQGETHKASRPSMAGSRSLGKKGISKGLYGKM